MKKLTKKQTETNRIKKFVNDCAENIIQAIPYTIEAEIDSILDYADTKQFAELINEDSLPIENKVLRETIKIAREQIAHNNRLMKEIKEEEFQNKMIKNAEQIES